MLNVIFVLTSIITQAHQFWKVLKVSSERVLIGKKIKLCLKISQNKIYAAKKEKNIKKVREFFKLNFNLHGFKKIAGINSLNKKERVQSADNFRITDKAHSFNSKTYK